MTESVPPPPRVLRDRYRLDARIGEGGMGVVYRGVDLALERDVAVKLTRAAPGADSNAAGRFLREVKSAAKIRHEHVVEVFDVGEAEGGDLFYVMELLDGEPLSHRLAREHRLAPAAAVHVAAQVCEALSAAHQGGIVHRDLKPANVMLLRRGRDDAFVKLIDFGISKSAEALTIPTRTGDLVGTVGYMAPEQIKGEAVDERTDVYALGAMLYRALTGSPVFEDRGLPAAVHDHLQTAPMKLRERAPEAGIPPALDAAVLRCLAKRPADRFASAASVAEALRASIASTSPQAADTSAPFEVLIEGGHVPPDAPLPTTESDPGPAPQFELAEIPLAPASMAPPGPRLCALCGTENQRYARSCAACGDELDSPEQVEFRARAPLALASSIIPLVPGNPGALSTPARPASSLAMLTGTAKARLSLHGAVVLLFLNAWAFGFGVLSTLLLLATLILWINVFLGPLRRRHR
jgi:serine/threonine protein kinase